jgi:hypothetical protein
MQNRLNITYGDKQFGRSGFMTGAVAAASGFDTSLWLFCVAFMLILACDS